jgi:hypothetical protein
MPNCECGNGRLQYTVHRAASVYTPRTVVVVNPPSRERVQDLVRAGGAARALEWMLDGASTATYADLPLTQESLELQLVEQGISPALARTMAAQAASAGEIESSGGEAAHLEGDSRREAERQASVVAMALAESRITVAELVSRTEVTNPLREVYESAYPDAFQLARLEALELLDRLPVLTGSYAYTRGDSTPGRTRLVPFRSPAGTYVVYSDIAETEAYFVRLAPRHVVSWLQRRGHVLPEPSTDREARLAILRSAIVPAPGDDVSGTLGSDLLTLVHSYAHRFIKEAALFGGIERNSLAELLVPLHLGFFVYAAARGDFVLGGLQAVFESDLDRLVTAVVEDENRCPLDPGCSRSGGACVACLHLGEPSCRYFNTYLDRRVLWGPVGYLD